MKGLYKCYSELCSEDFCVLGHRTRKSHPKKQKAIVYEDYVLDSLSDTDSSTSLNPFEFEDNYELKMIMNNIFHELVHEPSVYVVDSVNGLKHGYGEMQFQGKYSNIAYSTQWIYDVPTNKGFLYNRQTSQVIALIYSEWNIHFFERNDVPYFDVIDRDNGARWEGMSYNNKPCGYGEYYDENNTLIYRGLCVNFMWEGYGTLFYNDENSVHCEGWWIHGVLMGENEVYDRKGHMVFSGTTVNSKLITSTSCYIQGLMDLSSVHCYLEKLVIGDNSLNTITSFSLDLFRNLRKFVVGKRSFQQCCIFTAAHLPFLHSIAIGAESFSELGVNLELLLSEMKASLASKKRCAINDLPALHTLAFSTGSFSDFSSFAISNVPLLKDVRFGEVGQLSCNFFYAPFFTLSCIPSLQSAAIGDFGFYHANVVMLFKLNSLQSLFVGEACFFRYVNKSGRLVLSHLPNLQHIALLKQSLVSVNSLILSSIVY